MAARHATRPTLSTIALRAGVSRQVVSAILGVSPGGNVRYSAETRRRVMRLVRQTSFRPNRTAKNLVQKRHGALGVLVANFGAIHDGVLSIMLAEAHKHRQLLMLDEMPEGDEGLPVFLAEDSVDGLVVFEDLEPRLQREIERLAIPCVRVNANVRTQPGCITYDETGAMQMAVRHLVERGRRHLALIAGDAGGHYSQQLRRTGIQKAALSAGLPLVEVHTLGLRHYFGSDGHAASDGVAAFLDAHPQVDGVVLSVDGMAPLFYRACGRAGRRIPDDVAVVGVNNSPIALGVFPSLTSLFVEPRRVAEEAIRLLNESIEGERPPRAPVKLAYTLTIREST
jgi:DNA-binding LacI/PurR family transcriptional regulator